MYNFETPVKCEICGEGKPHLVVDESLCILNLDAVIADLEQPVTTSIPIYYFECGCCGVEYGGGESLTINPLLVELARREWKANQ
jgi:hypothetical protein